MRRLNVGRYHASIARTDVGGLLLTLSARTRSIQIHALLLHHRPRETR